MSSSDGSDPAAGDELGSSVALNGYTALVGSIFSNNGAGAAHVFGLVNPVCPTDLDGNGTVENLDYTLYLLPESHKACSPVQACPADFNGDGITDEVDADILRFDIRNFRGCEPMAASLTADNAYRLGWGPASGMGTSISFFPNVENVLNADITSCVPAGTGVETYVFNPAEHDFIYIAAYSDKAVSQGVLGQFTSFGGVKIDTGDPRWEVCATSANFDLGSGGPPVGPPVNLPSGTSINEEIAQCNSGGGPGNSGWVRRTGGSTGNLAAGQFNFAGTPDFGNIACIDPAARWMWFNENPGSIPDPFKPGANHHEYLIFRLPATFTPQSNLVPALAPLSAFALGAILLALGVRSVRMRAEVTRGKRR